MSSNGEFSTISSGEMPSLPKSLPSSREATAEGNSSSSGGFMPLGEFLDRFSLPRVVRLEGTGGRPVLLYKQQQRSLRVTATLLMHRYRHDVKVGPEIVIPEGYPGKWTYRYLLLYSTLQQPPPPPRSSPAARHRAVAPTRNSSSLRYFPPSYLLDLLLRE